jgi:hypothetical protein
MATRTSAMRSQELYLGSRRGRPIEHNIDFSMFPGKYEKTEILEDNSFDQLNNDRRDTLKDYSPEQNTLFASEAPQRVTFARDALNLREGAARSTTDPWANSGQNGGEGFDISFHDQDPRYYLTEQPWSEYRGQIQKRMQNFDYRDDGGYQETGLGVHPNTLYKNIAGTREWVKARLKVFSEEFGGRSNGGVGVYANTSKVYRSENENTSATVDGMAPSRTFDDPEVAQHHNVNISNLVHLGSKFIRAGTTTDHKVKVAAYGKLYKNRGLIPHETQMRIIEDDTPLSKIEGLRQGNKNLVKLMASQIYSDNEEISPYTASEMSRILRQTDQTTGKVREEMQNENRTVMLTKDIMALMGVTQNDIKYLESAQTGNRTAAHHELADLQNMVELVHKLPMNEKLQLKNELMLRSAGMGLAPATTEGLRAARNQIVINPKIVEFMESAARKTTAPNEENTILDKADIDPENKLDSRMETAAIFVYKNPDKATEDINGVLRKGVESAKKKDTTKRTASYKNLAKFAADNQKNTHQQIVTRQNVDARKTPTKVTAHYDKNNFYENMMNTAIDNTFNDNKFIERHGGHVGTKQMRRYMDTDYQSMDKMSDLTTPLL